MLAVRHNDDDDFLEIQGAMGQLSSELRKSENNIDISLYQIYFLKLYENFLKYYEFDLIQRNCH